MKVSKKRIWPLLVLALGKQHRFLLCETPFLAPCVTFLCACLSGKRHEAIILPGETARKERKTRDICGAEKCTRSERKSARDPRGKEIRLFSLCGAASFARVDVLIPEVHPENTVCPVIETFPRKRAKQETGKFQTRSETHFWVPKTPCAPCLKLFPGSGRCWRQESFKHGAKRIFGSQKHRAPRV